MPDDRLVTTIGFRLTITPGSGVIAPNFRLIPTTSVGLVVTAGRRLILASSVGLIVTPSIGFVITAGRGLILASSVGLIVTPSIGFVITAGRGLILAACSRLVLAPGTGGVFVTTRTRLVVVARLGRLVGWTAGLRVRFRVVAFSGRFGGLVVDRLPGFRGLAGTVVGGGVRLVGGVAGRRVCVFARRRGVGGMGRIPAATGLFRFRGDVVVARAGGGRFGRVVFGPRTGVGILTGGFGARGFGARFRSARAAVRGTGAAVGTRVCAGGLGTLAVRPWGIRPGSVGSGRIGLRSVRARGVCLRGVGARGVRARGVRARGCGRLACAGGGCALVR
ncbi:hypothetical protein ACFV4K_01405, partial [Nocardia sp. NPDC059764]